MTPNLRYINQSAPFWDFVASFEDGNHPFLNRNPNAGEGPSGPWGWHHRGMPHRGQRGHRGQPPYGSASEQEQNEKADSPETVQNDAEMREKDEAVPDPPEDTPGEGHPWRGRRHGRCGPGARHGPGAHRHHGCGARGPGFEFRGFGPGFPFRGSPHHHHGGPGGPEGFGFLADLFNPQPEDSGDFNPEADVFDTEPAFVVHLSLPGAHKEDIGVSWDSEKSELNIAGVVHRPGDEEFLKSMALDERKVGAFDRKVRLGTPASPAQVDIDGITAKLENGILVVEVPKLNQDFVEVRKVDIE